MNAGQCEHTHARAYSHTLLVQVLQPAHLRGCYQTASRLQQSTCGHSNCAKLPSQEQLHLVAAHIIHTFRRLCRNVLSVGSLAVHAESSICKQPWCTSQPDLTLAGSAVFAAF